MKQKRFLGILGAVFVVLGILVLGAAVPVMAADKGIPIDEEHFPDPGFRSVILQNNDTNGDHYLDDQERGVYNVYCRNYKNVKSLEGIEYFPDVRGVWCDGCNITSLDLSQNPEVTGVWCSENPLTYLNITKNSELVWLYCFKCELETVDVTHNPKMAYLECSDNPLKSIDLSKCPDLEHLIINSCQLEYLDLSNNPKISHLDALRTGLKELDLGNNPNLKRLDVWDNAGLVVDVSGLSGLEFFNCANCGLTSLDVSHNPQLMALICDWNQIPELDLSNNPRLADLRCGCNRLTKLDISHNPQLYYLQIFGNRISSVNINNNSRLRYILEQVEKGNGSMVYDPNSMSYDYLVDFGGDREYMDELRYFISIPTDLKLIADQPNEAADLYDVYINANDGFTGNEDFVTRGEAIQTMYELAGSPNVYGTSRFKDVAGTFYEKAVIWGEQNNICYGYPNLCSDTFCGDVVIARQDFALMVHHYAEGIPWLSAFDYGRTDDKADFFDIDYYAWGAVTYAIQWEILETKNNYTYPHGRLTTAEMENGLKEFLDHVDQYAVIHVSTAGGKGKTGSSVRIGETVTDLQIAKKGLQLQDTISINFKLSKASLQGKYHDPYLVVTQGGNVTKLTEYVVDGNDLVFIYRVAPHMIGEVAMVAPHAFCVNGKDVMGVNTEYSVAQYCYNMLSKNEYAGSQYATFRRLLVDILRYGDAAQLYVGYKPAELASRNLTSAQKAMGTDVNVAMTYNSVKEQNYKTVNSSEAWATIEKAALYLEAAVNVQFKFRANGPYDLRVVITDNAACTNVIGSYPASALQMDGGLYYVNVDALNAGQMKKTIYATVMKGDKKVSNTYRYSIESYAASMKGKNAKLDMLLDAMMRYGNSAEAYAKQ